MTDLYQRRGALAEGDASCVITPASAGWAYSGLVVLDLDAGQTHTVDTGSTEVAVLPLSTGCTVVSGDVTYELAGRSTVFGEITDWCYIGIGRNLSITATGSGQIALCTAEATRSIDPYYVAGTDVEVEIRGGGDGTRQINNFLSADMHDADTLIAVEVITPAGNWSSFPPHKHDEFTEDEVELEEIYYFKIDGDDGIGMFNLYTDDGAIGITEVVRDQDVVLVPRGYHGPAGAAPGYHMYYLNVMGGPSDERVWKFCDDPAHGWARSYLDSLEPDSRLPLRPS
jgi:5-deoxy-glucuronate isomerase